MARLRPTPMPRRLNQRLAKKRLCYTVSMVKTLEKAIAELSNLPADDQEQIGRKLLSHVERLRQLRGDIDKGVKSLDADKGKPLDIDRFLSAKHRRA